MERRLLNSGAPHHELINRFHLGLTGQLLLSSPPLSPHPVPNGVDS